MTNQATFMAGERARAVAWKQATAMLPSEAKVPAPYAGKGKAYDFCLPAQYAALSLLPEVRDQAIALFHELGIPWHRGIEGGPGSHLLSSQVQCVNALGQMVSEPERLGRAFGSLLGIAEVLEIEPGRHLTFEYIGDDDCLNEAVDGCRTRGAGCTSVDAAFLHRAIDGTVELVLVEWKYTERYGKRPIEPERDEIRRSRYEALLAAPGGPIRLDLLPFEELLQEPIYQLVRQQLLAHELERAHAHGADRVRVLHVLPAANNAYQQSLHGDAVRAVGATVKEVWQQLLHRPDRFTQVDSALFLDPEITSREYVARYGPPPLVAA
jgi:hypothetical protein